MNIFGFCFNCKLLTTIPPHIWPGKPFISKFLNLSNAFNTQSTLTAILPSKILLNNPNLPGWIIKDAFYSTSDSSIVDDNGNKVDSKWLTGDLVGV
jgi:hypothetical protein